MSISEFVQSPGYKKAMGKVYGVGAAVVILGALWKILHLPGAAPMLIAGLGTEAIIFLLSAFEPPHEMPDWSLVYPELVGLEPETPKSTRNVGGGGGGSDLAALIESGHLEPEVVEKLSLGIKKLTTTTSQLSDLSDASLATESYLQNMKQAGESLGNLSNMQIKSAKTLESSSDELASSYSVTAKTIANSGQKMADTLNKSGEHLVSSYSALSQSMSQQFESIASNSQNYSAHLESVNKNLSSINSAYELQLQGLNEQAQTAQGLNQGLTDIKDQLTQTVGDTKAYRDQVAQLSQTINELNTIYGNMLSAMNMGNR
ncbi:gliding motility protein GldL [Marinilabiliaceae bacterium JC017]|nr:gliding motility protein GldL [Marinilabiliaceae bacterium JC017]